MITKSRMAGRIRRIRMLLLDFDGVLTDGKIVYGEGGHELRVFDVVDGLGIVLLRNAGIPTVIVSSRQSGVLDRRAKELQVSACYQDVSDKRSLLEKLLKKHRLKNEEVCFIGDDLVDLPVLKRVGFAVGVANAVPEVKAQVDYVTKRAGGDGAVREVADHILKIQGKWKRAAGEYTDR